MLDPTRTALVMGHMCGACGAGTVAQDAVLAGRMPSPQGGWRGAPSLLPALHVTTCSPAGSRTEEKHTQSGAPAGHESTSFLSPWMRVHGKGASAGPVAPRCLTPCPERAGVSQSEDHVFTQNSKPSLSQCPLPALPGPQGAGSRLCHQEDPHLPWASRQGTAASSPSFEWDQEQQREGLGDYGVRNGRPERRVCLRAGCMQTNPLQLYTTDD